VAGVKEPRLKAITAIVPEFVIVFLETRFVETVFTIFLMVAFLSLEPAIMNNACGFF